MPPSGESFALLPNGDLSDDDDAHDTFFSSLDAEHDPDHVHDHPPTPRVRRVKQQLDAATSQAGHGHPAQEHLHSPALQVRLQQSVRHGFGAVWKAMHLNRSNDKKSMADGSVSNPVYWKMARKERRARVVRGVFFVAVLTMMAQTSVSPSLLLFMNDAGYTTPSHITPYVIAAALSTAVPVLSNIALTELASRIGPGRALAIGGAISAFGLLLVVLTRGSLHLFLLGYALYASSNSFRVVRLSLLSKVVAPAKRTTALATHALMTPLGALLGPLIWIAAQMYRSKIHLLGGLLVFDRFSINYVFGAAYFTAISIIAAVRLRNVVAYSDGEDDSDETSSQENSGADHRGQHHLHDAVIRFSDGHEVTINLQRYRNTVFCFFCAIMVGVNLSAGLFMTAFQPVLVNKFLMSDAQLGYIFELIAVFALLPPLLVAVLSRYLKDRQILFIGLSIKLVGMALFLPLFGAVCEWQVILGFLLIIKASIFFSTASMSLFTKLLGPMSTSSLLGLLASASSIGPAIAQILLSGHIVRWFGSFLFAIFALPAMCSLGAILWPSHWRRLDHSCEFTSLVTHEAELQQASDP